MANIFSAFKIAANLGKIKQVVETVYNVIDKVIPVVDLIIAQTKGTVVETTVNKYAPVITSTLNKVKDAIVKYGMLVGFVPVASAQSTSADVKKELDSALAQLDKLMK